MKFDLGVAMLSEYDADGFIGIQVDLYGEQAASAPAFEGHHQYGFLSVPLDPEKDSTAQPTANACSVLYGWEGSRGHVWLLGDPRVTTKLPKVVKGGSIQYGATGSFHVIDGKTGTQVLYVPYAFGPDGKPTKALTLQLNVDAVGQENISIIHGDGMAITMTSGAKSSVVIKNKSGSSYFEVNDDGMVSSGSHVVQGMLQVGAGAQPLALAPPLIQLLTQLINIVAAINATTTGAPAAALQAQLATIAAKAAMSR